MNSGSLINAAIAIFGCYNIFQQVTSENTLVNFFGITMNKWIYVGIWAVIIYTCIAPIYKAYKYKQRSK